MNYRARYELSMYGGRRKYICVSKLSSERLLSTWTESKKPMEFHQREDGKEIKTSSGNIDGIKIINILKSLPSVH